MNKKDYLKEKLSNEEKVYLKRIIMSARNKYINKNYLYINGIVELEESHAITSDYIIDNIMQDYVKEMKSATDIERTISNTLLYKYVKELSIKEKEVLFYIFWKNKKIKDVADIMNIHRITVERIRDRALTKIGYKMVEGGKRNV